MSTGSGNVAFEGTGPRCLDHGGERIVRQAAGSTDICELAGRLDDSQLLDGGGTIDEMAPGLEPAPYQFIVRGAEPEAVHFDADARALQSQFLEDSLEFLRRIGIHRIEPQADIIDD